MEDKRVTKLDILRKVAPDAKEIMDANIFGKLPKDKVSEIVERLMLMHRSFQLIAEMEVVANMKPPVESDKKKKESKKKGK